MTHTIPANRHYCTTILRHVYLRKRKEKIKITFESNCLLADDSGDVHKLTGRTFGFDVHWNSFRIGWKPENDCIQLYIYTYTNGQRQIKPLQTIFYDKSNTASTYLIIDYTYHFVKVNGMITDYCLKYLPCYGLRCYPYHGGDLVAPVEMKIRVRY